MTEDGCCVVNGCKNNANINKEFEYYRFPQEREKLRRWARMINRSDIAALEDVSHLVICSAHLVPVADTDATWGGGPARPPGPVQLDPPPAGAAIPMFYTFNVNTDDIQDDPEEDARRQAELQSKLAKIRDPQEHNKRKGKTRHFMETNTDDKFTEVLMTWQAQFTQRFFADPTADRTELLHFAINMFFSNSQVYKFTRALLPSLPSVTELQEATVYNRTGCNEEMIDMIGHKLNRLRPREYKFCTLCIDEIPLKKNLYYDAVHDEVVGLHEVQGRRRGRLAERGVVAQLRGVAAVWSQALGYALLHGGGGHADELGDWLDRMLELSARAGFLVLGVVAGPQPALRDLARDRGVSVDRPFIIFDDKKYFWIFDVPDLTNTIRDELMAHDFEFSDGGVASWEHIRVFYETDLKADFRTVAKLTESHVAPRGAERREVRLAAQVFSYKVAAFLNVLIDRGSVPPEARGTVQFLLTLNNTYDILNAVKPKTENRNKKAYCGEDFQVEQLQSACDMFSSIKFKTDDANAKQSATLECFQITINAVMQLFDHCRCAELPFLLTRRLNLDSLRELVARARRGRERPAAAQLAAGYCALLVDSLLACPLVKDSQEPSAASLVCADDMETTCFLQDYSPPPLIDDWIPADFKYDCPKEEFIKNVTLYIVKKCLDMHDCEDFRRFVRHTMGEEGYTQLQRARLGRAARLPDVAAPRMFVVMVEGMELAFQKFAASLMTALGPGNCLVAVFQAIDFIYPCECFPATRVMRLFTRMRLQKEVEVVNENIAQSYDTISEYMKANVLSENKVVVMDTTE
ncbi:unnamed protein product [Plutella xylostella]|uniref:(diamondback moth) hypothetical protein n=1 Tax=Plutella xylostella TaxID=51655 RepID=A0A8S4FPN4_PLUXY|nr:unnamed protein product [Plutella xylostella]